MILVFKKGDSMKDDNICCPEFNPLQWNNQSFVWSNKRFISATVPTIFYMPIGFGKVMEKMTEKVEIDGGVFTDNLCLSSHESPWKMNLYLAVDKEIFDAKNILLSGKFFSKVYEGPFKDTGKWINDFENDMKARHYNVNKWYMWYTTCPKCAKKYGKNYVVIIGKIE